MHAIYFSNSDESKFQKNSLRLFRMGPPLANLDSFIQGLHAGTFSLLHEMNVSIKLPFPETTGITYHTANQFY
jgi:hypothetical protein